MPVELLQQLSYFLLFLFAASMLWLAIIFLFSLISLGSLLFVGFCYLGHC